MVFNKGGSVQLTLLYMVGRSRTSCTVELYMYRCYPYCIHCCTIVVLYMVGRYTYTMYGRTIHVTMYSRCIHMYSGSTHRDIACSCLRSCQYIPCILSLYITFLMYTPTIHHVYCHYTSSF